MAVFDIRLVGDPVLRTQAEEVTDIDEKLSETCSLMIESMYKAEGIGLAAPQVGILKRFFVYDLQDDQGPQIIINPVIKESEGEWMYEEGCLSVPGFAWNIVRPKTVNLVGVNLDGNEIEMEADELFARLIQHEMDHLDGVLLLQRLDTDSRRQALSDIRTGKGNLSHKAL